jgi:hypothetical protein
MSQPLSDFVSLWVALAGGAEPAADSATLVERHFRSFHGDELNAVLTIWAERPKNDSGLDDWIYNHLFSDPNRRSTCKDLVLTIWFGLPYRHGKPTELSDPLLPKELEERELLWQSGLFWNVVRSHAPGLPLTNYGEWSQPPREG